MAYYVLDSDEDDTGAMLMRRPTLPILDSVTFDRGLLISEQIPHIELHMDEETQGEIFDYVWTTLSGLLISGRFRRLLESLGVDNIQYFSARIVNDVAGEIHSDYHVANIVGRIACLDFERSEVTRIPMLPNKLRSIEELHLIESSIQGQAIFRLDEWSPLIICNETIQTAAINARIRGCVFTPAEGYNI